MQWKSKAGLKPRDLKMGAIRNNGEILRVNPKADKKVLTLAWAAFVCRYICIEIAKADARGGNLLAACHISIAHSSTLHYQA